MSNSIYRKKKGAVAFLGGSITHNPGWRDMVCAYLQRKFPETEFTFIAAGVPSEGSTSAAFRMQNDVLAKGNVDLLFEEAAVNDRSEALRRSSDDRIRGMEGIVRQARSNNPKMDIVIMNFVDPDKMKDYNSGITPQEILDFEKVADYYDIPTINLAKEVTDRINVGEFNWKDDFKNLHPSPFGQKIYYRTMYHFLENAFKVSSGVKEITDYNMPSSLDAFCYDDCLFVSINEAKLGKKWSIDPLWQPKRNERVRTGYTDIPMLVAEDVSDELSLKFKGRAVGIIVMSGADAGTIEYSVDGKEYENYDTFTSNSSYQHLPRYVVLASELDGKKKHTLKLKLADDANKASIGNACRIVTFFVNK